MDNDQSRYFAAIERNLIELQGARLNRATLVAMEESERISHLVSKVFYIALHNDYLARCMKVFERGGAAASFWYIYRIDPRPLDECAKQMDFKVAELEPITVKLKHLRDKMHFHIDRVGVQNSEAVWADADLNALDLRNAVDDAWDLLNHLQLRLGRAPKSDPDVDTDLVTEVTRLIEGRRVQQ